MKKIAILSLFLVSASFFSQSRDLDFRRGYNDAYEKIAGNRPMFEATKAVAANLANRWDSQATLNAEVQSMQQGRGKWDPDKSGYYYEGYWKGLEDAKSDQLAEDKKKSK